MTHPATSTVVVTGQNPYEAEPPAASASRRIPLMMVNRLAMKQSTKRTSLSRPSRGCVYQKRCPALPMA